MAGIISFIRILIILMILYVITVIVLWTVFRSSRIECENNEHPLCYTMVCPNGSPAFRRDVNGEIQLSGGGLVPPNPVS